MGFTREDALPQAGSHLAVREADPYVAGQAFDSARGTKEACQPSSVACRRP